MEFLLIALALLLPSVLGISLVNLLLPAGVPARIPVVAGYGILLGLVLVPLLMRFLNLVGAGAGFPVTAALCVLLTALAVFFHVRRGQADVPAPAANGAVFANLSRPEQALYLLFAVLLVSHVILPAVELMGRPLYPFDATMHWATKARVWFEQGELVPFVDNTAWLKMGGDGVYTDHHAVYPVTTPLLQVWMTSAIGRWDESVMNLPWVRIWP